MYGLSIFLSISSLSLFTEQLYIILILFLMNLSVFSNLLKDTQIHILADSDEQEVVQQVQVIFYNSALVVSLLHDVFE